MLRDRNPRCARLAARAGRLTSLETANNIVRD